MVAINHANPSDARQATLDLFTAEDAPEPEDQAELEQMREAGVRMREGKYLLGEQSYDQLADALAYSRLRRTHRTRTGDAK